MIKNPFNQQHTEFIYGLPGIGKSLAVARLQKYFDHGKDLCLNLQGKQVVQGITYTKDYIRVRNYPDIKAYLMPRNSRIAWRRSLELFHLVQPNVPRVIIDEAEDWPLIKLIQLYQDLIRIFSKPGHVIDVIFVGVIINNRNHYYTTTKYLLNHCPCKNLNPKCKYCNRRASLMLNVFQGCKITYSQIDLYSKPQQKFIENHMKRYHVCKHHYYYPPMNGFVVRKGN